MFDIANQLMFATNNANEKYHNNLSDIEYSWSYDFKKKITTIKIIKWLYFHNIFDYKVIENEKKFRKLENAIKFLEKQAKI